VKGVGPALAALAATEAAIEAVARVHDRPPFTVVALVALAGVAPIALVRLWPGTAAVLSAVAVVSGLLLSSPVTVGGIATLTALCGVAGYRCRTATAVSLLLPLVAYAVTPFAAARPGGRTLALVLLVTSGLAVAAGAALRLREEWRRHRASEQSAAASLMEYAARGERARIARELHDVVAHHISMIAVQAESARLTTPGMPPTGAQRLSAIGDTARDALTEMRRLLGVLREDTTPMPVPVRTPQPGLAQLNDLLDEARTASGVGTRLILSGVPLVLDPGVELAAYRIIQEALTNARRHAPGAAVDVELHFGADELEVAVRDNGPGAADVGDPAAVGGHGLLGMSERAIAVGGTLRAGPAAGGGFLVRATLPAKGPAVVGRAAHHDPAGGPSADRPAPAEGAAA